MKITTKLISLLLIALAATGLAACGNDKDEPLPQAEPVNIYPTLPAAHKRVSSIERTYANGVTAKVDAGYDNAGHLISATMTMDYNRGDLDESVELFYSRGILRHKLGWQTTDYVFKVNSYGAITSLTNTSGRTIASFSYAGRQLQSLSSSTSSASYSTLVGWKNSDNIHSVVTRTASKRDSVLMNYSAPLDNVALVDVMGMGRSPFGSLMELLLRSEGLFGDVSAQLPRTMLYGNSARVDDNGDMVMARCVLDFTTNPDGSISQMRFTAPRNADNEQITTLESYTLNFSYR